MRASSRHVLRAVSPDPQTQACTQPAPLVRWAHAGRAAPPRVTYPCFLHLFRDFRFIFLERQEEEKQAVTVAGSPGSTRLGRRAGGEGAALWPRGAPAARAEPSGREEENPTPSGSAAVDPPVPIATDAHTRHF